MLKGKNIVYFIVYKFLNLELFFLIYKFILF